MSDTKNPNESTTLTLDQLVPHHEQQPSSHNEDVKNKAKQEIEPTVTGATNIPDSSGSVQIVSECDLEPGIHKAKIKETSKEIIDAGGTEDLHRFRTGDRENNISYNNMYNYFREHIFPLYEPRKIPRVTKMRNQHEAGGSEKYPPGRLYTPIQTNWPSVQPAALLPTPQTMPAQPHYINNVAQHPLLSTSFMAQNNHVVQKMFNHKDNVNHMMQTYCAKQAKLKKTNKVESYKFEPYINKSEITEGIKNNILIEGTIRINPKQFQHAYLTGNDRSEPDIFIDGLKNRNRALEGDVVVVQLLPDNESDDSADEKLKRRGKVVYIKEKNHKRLCLGTLKLMADKNRKRALFVPRDSRVPRLNVPCTCWPNNFYNDSKKYENTLFIAKIFDWFDTRFALGKIIVLVGQSGDMISESKAILAQNDLDVKPFGPEVRHLFPGDDYTIPEEEIKAREDCRNLCLFSIDPHNCRDIDDAVSCKLLDNGNYEIGVHISDVAHFLKENTVLDEQVAEKATTIYMVEQAYHMLPDELCVLCSLFPGEDKLAFSVFWEITEDAKVLSHRFAKTVIHSCCQLAYDHAQAILEDQDDAESTFPEIYNGQKYEDIKKTIKILGKLSAIFRGQRFESGALRIDQPKVSFKLSPQLLPDSFSIYESKSSHQLIEEFMLLANMTVAKRIYDDYPEIAFLRCHPPPSLHMMRQLQKSLSPMGIDLDITSAGSVHRSLVEYAGPDSTDRGRAMVLSMLCAKPMARAKYFCAGGVQEDDDFAHYALNVPLYTHFTSPIRRYADIMVHRLLAASIKCREAPEWPVDHVRAIAAQCNKQKFNAKRAGEMSTELYTLKYIQMHSPVVTEAVIVDVRERFLDVIIVAMGLNRRIYFNNKFPGTCKYIKNDAGAKLAKIEITWKATATEPEVSQVVQVFSVVKVEMVKGEDVIKVDTNLVRPDAPPTDEAPIDTSTNLLSTLTLT